MEPASPPDTDSAEVRVPVEGVPWQGLPRAASGRYARGAMDTRSEIREFLTSRRAKVTPDRRGLPDYGTRRVPGLRREEVAVLAGVSVRYYTRLERGDLAGVSESVLDALAACAPARRRRARPPLRPRPRRTAHPAGPAPRRPSSASGPRCSGPSTR